MEGIGWYAYEILKRITKSHPEVEFLFLFDRPFDKQFIFSGNVRGIKIFPQARHPLLYKWWFDFSIPKILKKEKIDLFFSPEGYISLNSNVPAVNVMHDLAFEHFPDHVSKTELKFYKKYFPLYAEKAAEIITVSEFSKNDISKLYKIDPKKINVIYNGVRSGLTSKTVTREREGKPYFIYIGSIHPRKNIKNMMKAFDIFCENDPDHELLVVGRKMSKNDEIMELLHELKHHKKIKFLGYQEDHILEKMLKGARALVYIPLFEGFGLPVIEAFKSGVPVITSNTSSIPEVAGDAALLVDPYSVDEVAGAMAKINNDKLRNSLSEKGVTRASDFSWDKASEQTWEVLKRNCG